MSSEWTPNVAFSYLVRCSLLVFFKELLIDAEVPLRNEPQFKFFEHIDENVSIDELNWQYSIPSGFLLGFKSESAGGNDQTLVCSAHHGTAKISDLGWIDSSLVPLALEQYVEADEWIDLKYSNTVNATVIALTRHRDMLEPGLTEQSLTKPFEPTGR